MEHVATEITDAVLAVAGGRAAPTTSDRGRVVVVCAETERDTLPERMMTELLRFEGFIMVFLACATRPESVAGFPSTFKPDARLVSCPIAMNLPSVAPILTASGQPRLPPCVEDTRSVTMRAMRVSSASAGRPTSPQPSRSSIAGKHSYPTPPRSPQPDQPPPNRSSSTTVAGGALRRRARHRAQRQTSASAQWWRREFDAVLRFLNAAVLPDDNSILAARRTLDGVITDQAFDIRAGHGARGARQEYHDRDYRRPASARSTSRRELFAGYERDDLDCVLLSTAGNPEFPEVFAVEAARHAAANSLWESYVGPVGPCRPPAGVVNPNGAWAARCVSGDHDAMVVIEIDTSTGERARAWRRSVRESRAPMSPWPNSRVRRKAGADPRFNEGCVCRHGRVFTAMPWVARRVRCSFGPCDGTCVPREGGQRAPNGDARRRAKARLRRAAA